MSSIVAPGWPFGRLGLRPDFPRSDFGDLGHGQNSTTTRPRPQIGEHPSRRRFTRVADGTEGTTANAGFATGYDYAVLCADYQGVKSAAPFDPIPPNSGQINNASTTITVPWVTATQPSDELAWFGVSTGPSGTAPGVIGVPSGFTAKVTQNNSANTTGRNLGSIFADKSATFIGATGNENGISSTSVVNGGILVSLRSAAASVM